MTATHRHPELLEKLAEGIGNLTSSEQWQRHLDVQSRFHRYSFGNVLLIAAQRPEATQVAGFNAWRKLNRSVRKGEKAIWILAPMVYRTSDTHADNDDERVIRGFKFVPVFDLAQTDGDALPAVCHQLDGDDPAGHYAQLVSVAQSIGFTVEDHELAGPNGDCCHSERRIRVEARNMPVQRVKTLAHELGHAILHEPGEDRPRSRALLELEAESVAYVVCQNLSIETSDYSFGYVATWAGGGSEAREAIKAYGTRIQRAADQILTAVEAVQSLAREAVA